MGASDSEAWLHQAPRCVRQTGPAAKTKHCGFGDGKAVQKKTIKAKIWARGPRRDADTSKQKKQHFCGYKVCVGLTLRWGGPPNPTQM